MGANPALILVTLASARHLDYLDALVGIGLLENRLQVSNTGFVELMGMYDSLHRSTLGPFDGSRHRHIDVVQQHRVARRADGPASSSSVPSR